MAKAGEISSSITPITDYSLNRNQYYPTYFKKKRTQIASPLRKGEIVQGTILTNAVNSIAKVRLPVGTFEAVLHNNLKQGDRLFFKVYEIKPVLNLKVHSVNTKINNNKISTEEILRILDIQKDQLNSSIIEILRSQNNTIIKEKVLLLVNNFNTFSDEILSGKDLKAVIKTIYWISEANLYFNDTHFNLLYPYFQGLSYFNILMNDLIEVVYYNNNEYYSKTKKIINNIIAETDFRNLATSYSKHINNNFLLYNNLKSIVNNNINYQHKQLINSIISIFDSMHKWNAVANISDVPYNLFIPIAYKDSKLYNAQLIIRNYNKVEFKGKIKIEADDPDCDFGAKIRRLNDFDLQLKNIYDDKYLTDFAFNLREKFMNHNYSLQAFIIDLYNRETDLLPELPKSPVKNISVVI